MKGKTEKGFKFEIEDAVLDDIQFFEALAGADENPLKLPKLLEVMLGEEQKKAMYEFYKDEEDGRTHTSVIMDALIEMVGIIEEQNGSKN